MLQFNQFYIHRQFISHSFIIIYTLFLVLVSTTTTTRTRSPEPQKEYNNRVSHSPVVKFSQLQSLNWVSELCDAYSMQHFLFLVFIFGLKFIINNLKKKKQTALEINRKFLKVCRYVDIISLKQKLKPFGIVYKLTSTFKTKETRKK